MFFVCLDVLSVFNLAVFDVVDHQPSHDGAGAESLRDAKFIWEGIELEDFTEDHFNNHFGRIMVDWGRALGASVTFFDGADASFYVWDMFVLAADVEFRFEFGGNGAAGAVKFGVAHDVGDSEAAFAIDAVDFF